MHCLRFVWFIETRCVSRQRQEILDSSPEKWIHIHRCCHQTIDCTGNACTVDATEVEFNRGGGKNQRTRLEPGELDAHAKALPLHLTVDASTLGMGVNGYKLCPSDFYVHNAGIAHKNVCITLFFFVLCRTKALFVKICPLGSGAGLMIKKKPIFSLSFSPSNSYSFFLTVHIFVCFSFSLP